MEDLLARLMKMKNEIIPLLEKTAGVPFAEPQANAFDEAISLCIAETEAPASPEAQLAFAQGKNAAYELALNALTRQK